MDLKYYLIGGAALVLIIFALWFVHFIKMQRAKKIGKDGEKVVAKMLAKYAGIRSYKVLNDVYLPLYDKTTQIDHILVGFFGILVVETKNLSGEVYGDPKKKDWLHIIGKKNQKKHKLYNPIMQNQTHVDCIRHILSKENIYKTNIESIVVFPSKKIQLFIPKGLPIVTKKLFKKFIHQPRFQKDNDVDVDLLVNTIRKYEITDKKRINNHVKNVKKMVKDNK